MTDKETIKRLQAEVKAANQKVERYTWAMGLLKDVVRENKGSLDNFIKTTEGLLEDYDDNGNT